MPRPAEIKALLVETQTSLDAEQARVAELFAERDAAIAQRDAVIVERDAAIVEKDELIAQRDATIVALQAIIDAGGGDPATLQEISDAIATLKGDIEGTVE